MWDWSLGIFDHSRPQVKKPSCLTATEVKVSAPLFPDMLTRSQLNAQASTQHGCNRMSSWWLGCPHPSPQLQIARSQAGLCRMITGFSGLQDNICTATTANKGLSLLLICKPSSTGLLQNGESLASFAVSTWLKFIRLPFIFSFAFTAPFKL